MVLRRHIFVENVDSFIKACGFHKMNVTLLNSMDYRGL